MSSGVSEDLGHIYGDNDMKSDISDFDKVAGFHTKRVFLWRSVFHWYYF